MSRPATIWHAGGLLVALALMVVGTARTRAAQTNGFVPLDLSAHGQKVPARVVRALPPGTVMSDGVPFRPGLPVSVTGIDPAGRGELFPAEVTGLPGGRAVRRLHLLLATLRTDKDGVPMAHVVWHYGDGTSAKVRLGYGVHARNWIPPRGEKRAELLAPDARLAWTATDADADASPRLFHAALDNPRPGQTVRSWDLASLFSLAAPVVVAATVETPAAAPASARHGSERRAARALHELPDEVYRAEFRVRVTNSLSGQPATNATVSLTIADDTRNIFLGEVKTDATGLARVPYPPQNTFGFTLWVQAPGLEPQLISETKATVTQFKGEYSLVLGLGRDIGGVIRSPAGGTVGGARVAVYRLIRNGSRTFSRVDHDVVTTDASGQWRTTAAPRGLEGLFLHVTHPDYRPGLFGTTYFEPVSSSASSSGSTTTRWLVEGEIITTSRRLGNGSRPGAEMLLDTNALASRTANVTLQPAPLISGTLTDPAGHAMPDTEMLAQMASTARSATRTDAQGRFRFRVPEPGPVELFVLGTPYAPLRQQMTAGTQDATAALRLQPPRVLVGRVVDQKRRPVPGARVQLEEWMNTTDLMRFQAVTDEAGQFHWTNAPAGNVLFQTTKTNFSTSRHSFGGAMTEVTITLSRPSGIYGRVLDARTRQPVESFAVIPGRKYSQNDTRIHWDRSEMLRGSGGEFALKLSSYFFQPEARALVEAPGYRPQISPAFNGIDAHTNDFLLEPARGIAGVVVAPDGRPAAGAALTLIEKGETAYLDTSTGRVRSGNGGSDGVHSDGQGRFEFVARLAPERIYVTHDFGFAEARADDAAGTGRITLRPWGRIEGTMRVGEKGQTEAVIRTANETGLTYDQDGNATGLGVTLKAEPDAEGRFAFDRVPPGDHQVSVEYRFKDDRYGSAALSHGIHVPVRAGATNMIVLGGTGRQVRGRVILSGGDHGDVDWRRDVHLLTLNVPPPATSPGTPQRTVIQNGIVFLNEILNAQPAAQAVDATALRDWQRQVRSYVLLFETNGVFRADHVPPGQYQLALNVTDPEDEYYNRRSIGETNRTIVIPDEPGAAVNAPFDLGAIPLHIRPRLRLGRTVPEIEGPGRDGKVVRLSSFRGKPVLLHFWGTSIGYSTSDFQALRELQRSHGESGQLVIVSCNLDPANYNPGDFAGREGFTWPQIFLGAWQNTPVPGWFGLSGGSGSVLIDGEGRLASGLLRGSNMRSSVLSAMEE